MIQISHNNLFYQFLTLKIDPFQLFFWSDMHMGHDKEFLYSKRGFSNVEEHDLTLKLRWNKTIDYNGVVFHLGDIMFGQNGEERIIKLLDQLNFDTLFLQPGNHAAGFKQLLSLATWENNVPVYYSNGRPVYFLPNYFELMVNGQSVVLSHYPIFSFNGQSKGSFMIFGHCHSSLTSTEMGKEYLRGKCLDVGAESCMIPISFKVVCDYMKRQELAVYDHHDSKTNNPF